MAFKKYLSIFTICISLLGAYSALAKERVKIKVALFNAHPFAFKENSKVMGITKNLAIKILSKEFDIEFSVLPYARIIKQLKNEEIDLTIMYHNDDIAKSSINVGDTLGNDNLIISLVKKPVNSVSELKLKKVGVLHAADYGKEIEEVSFERSDVQNYKQSIELLNHQKVDCAVISSAAWKYYVKNLKLNKSMYKVVKVNFKANSIFVKKSMSKDQVKLVSRLNKMFLSKFRNIKLDQLVN